MENYKKGEGKTLGEKNDDRSRKTNEKTIKRIRKKGLRKSPFRYGRYDRKHETKFSFE